MLDAQSVVQRLRQIKQEAAEKEAQLLELLKQRGVHRI